MPHATLHISGNAAKFAADAPGYIGLRQKERAEAVDRGLKKAQEVGGVTLLGKMPRNKLNEELAEAAVFAFPCELLGPCETFSISIMECLAIGLPTVLIPQDALESIYKGSLVLSTKEKFADDVVAGVGGLPGGTRSQGQSAGSPSHLRERGSYPGFYYQHLQS